MVRDGLARYAKRVYVSRLDNLPVSWIGNDITITSMAAYARHDTTFFSQRALFLIAIIIIHIGLIYLFESGLATRIIHMAEPPLQTTIVQDVKQRDTPPPPPPPKMERPPVEIPPPDVTINIPVEQPRLPLPTPRPSMSTHRRRRRRRPWYARRAVPLTKLDPANFYPPTSIRMNETGSTLIKYCWAADGKLVGAPTVEKSSGSSRLDEAAVRLGSQEHMKPGTVDGKPVDGCSSLSVKFQLN